MESNATTQLSRAKLIVLALCALLLTAASIGLFVTSRAARLKVAQDNWPWWRGYHQTNVADGSAPTNWSADQNIVWKQALPGRGHGSPIIASQQLFLATADEQAKVLSLLSLDRQTGEQNWQCELQRDALMHKSIKNSYASASPAYDGDRVFYPWIADNALWLAAVSLTGDVIWKERIVPFVSEHGYASSPCLYNSLVIISSDNPGPSFLTAIDRQSGEVVWQTQRGVGGSYATPIIASLSGQDQLLLSGQNSVVSYDPQTGDERWRCEGPGPSTIGTMAWHGKLAYATCGAPPMLAGVMAIDSSTGNIAWQADAMANVPSPLVVEDRLLITEDRGTIVCFSAESGERLWKQRLGGNFSASPVLAGELVYLPNESGKMYVFRVGEEFELVAENDLADGGFASPVIVGGRIYLRTNHHLYCIGD